MTGLSGEAVEETAVGVIGAEVIEVVVGDVGVLGD